MIFSELFSANMTKTRSSLIAFGFSVIGFLIVFVGFNVAYMIWAVRAYPHSNSMAGLAAFIYGMPIAGAAALVIFIGTFWVCVRRTAKDAEANPNIR